MHKTYKIVAVFLFFSLQLVSQNAEPKDSLYADSIIEFSKKYLGTKYKYANCSPQAGFDCSGFVYYVFTHFNIKVPRSSSEYAKFGMEVHPDSCKTGDVIVFTGTNPKKRSPGHVGIVLSNNGEDISFIHSSSDKRTGGVKISSRNDAHYYKQRFIKIVRVTNVL